MDFSKANVSIWFSLPWELETWIQGQDRVVHPLKQDPVLIVALLAEGTIDEDIFEALQMKGATSRTMLNAIKKRIQERISNKCLH